MNVQLIHQRLNNDDLITNESASHLEQQIANYLKENPADPKKLSQQMARSNLLYRVDAQRAKSFLEELVQDPDQQLVQAAQARLATAELLSNPLDLHFTATNGSEIDLAQLLGKVVHINFWSSLCPESVLYLRK